MLKNSAHIIRHAVALLLAGSAIVLLFSCKSKKETESFNPETLMTMRSDSLTMSQSENGNLKYIMRTPLMERYELAREPYSKYPLGLYVESYKDSSDVIQSTVKGDYGIYYEKRDEWMLRGNVVATGEDGRTLYTEQLFYNVKTGRVFSNVESIVVQGEDVFVGEGFESDDKFEQWVFRNYINRFAVEEFMDEGEDTGPGDPTGIETPGDGDGADMDRDSLGGGVSAGRISGPRIVRPDSIGPGQERARREGTGQSMVKPNPPEIRQRDSVATGTSEERKTE